MGASSQRSKSAGAPSAEELRQIASRLMELADSAFESGKADMGVSCAKMEFTDHDLALEATDIYQSRRQRTRFLPEHLFTEPAWDMLLDLFIQTVRKRRITTTSICLAGGIPVSTGLRWLKVLEDKDIIERFTAEDDHRLTIIQLTTKGFGDMRGYLVDRIQRRNQLAGDSHLRSAASER